MEERERSPQQLLLTTTDPHLGKKRVKIQHISTLKDNYVWVIINEANHAIIIDPGEAVPVITFLRQHQLQLTAILITHHHWDHTNGIAEIVREFPAPVYGPAHENIPEMTHAVSEKTPIHIPHFPDITALEIPGHTSGHLAYDIQGNLFCGDTLFAAGCGRLFEGSPEQMAASLQKIMSLPDNTKIYCAHEYTQNNLRFAQTVEPNNKAIAERIKHVAEMRKQNLPSLPSTLKEEKETNPFLRCDAPEVKASVEKHAGHALNNKIAVFAVLRKWKDEF
jgi:hydroxyacylglutathione hydrolase